MIKVLTNFYDDINIKTILSEYGIDIDTINDTSVVNTNEEGFLKDKTLFIGKEDLYKNLLDNKKLTIFTKILPLRLVEDSPIINEAYLEVIKEVFNAGGNVNILGQVVTNLERDIVYCIVYQFIFPEDKQVKYYVVELS